VFNAGKTAKRTQHSIIPQCFITSNSHSELSMEDLALANKKQQSALSVSTSTFSSIQQQSTKSTPHTIRHHASWRKRACYRQR
jgi:hypothetical protein